MHDKFTDQSPNSIEKISGRPINSGHLCDVKSNQPYPDPVSLKPKAKIQPSKTKSDPAKTAVPSNDPIE